MTNRNKKVRKNKLESKITNKSENKGKEKRKIWYGRHI